MFLLNFEHNLQLAKDKCNGKYTEELTKKFYMLYPFTNENIGGYIQKFPLKNKSLLTIGSSFDQALNAILYQCKKITFLDICPNAKVYAYLKMACLLELEREEFCQFLRYKNYPKPFIDNPLLYNKRDYNKIWKTLRLLNDEAYLFWDELFNTFSPEVIRNSLFFNLEEDKQSALEMYNPYLRNTLLYQETKEKLKKAKIEFINADLFTVTLKKKFDTIWLSNLATYIESYEKIKKLILKMKPCLHENGKMLLCYLYDTEANQKYHAHSSFLYNLEETLAYFQEFHPQLFSFQGTYSIQFHNQTKDSILTLTKK